MKKNYFVFICLLFLVITVPGAAAPAFALSLGTADAYNAFIFGDFTSQNSDVQGRLAAGGNVSLQNYALGDGLPVDTSGTTNTLVAGGSLTFTNGQINNGNAVIGQTATLSGVNVPQGTLTQNAAVPIDFAAEQTYLTDLSTQLAAMAATGTVKYESWGGLFFTGDGASDLQVFNIDGSLLATANTFGFLNNIANAPENATMVFNVSGESASMHNFGMDAFKNALGASYDNVLFNFYEAGSLTLYGIAIQGSILAPLADVQADNGNINGTAIAQSWDGTMQFHHVPFESTESTTPAPVSGTLILLFSGLIALAGLKRKIS